MIYIDYSQIPPEDERPEDYTLPLLVIPKTNENSY